MATVDTSSSNLLRSLINSAEKASNIARKCRSNKHLLQLLVQEKSGSEANTRFDHDFKTLADVLIQETIRHDISKVFSTLAKNIRGEESPNFTNQQGETIQICVGKNENETAKCLSTIMPGFDEAAKVLAAEVHRKVTYDDNTLGIIPELPINVDYSNLAIWIDPIDATAEYISGESVFTDFPGITSTGLDCVTVLIGVYNRSTGDPIMGVVSQPFHQKIANNQYKSTIHWGVSWGDLRANNCQVSSPRRNKRLGIFSSSENAVILQRICSMGYEFVFSAGAGHKALKVVTKEADFYLLSKPSTFKWDTCAPHAILRSMGGDIFDFKKSLNQQQPVRLKYAENSDNMNDWKCNKGGLIAVRDVNIIHDLLDRLNE